MAEVETWWTINGAELLVMLRRCANGENPDMVYAEVYANAEQEEEEE